MSAYTLYDYTETLRAAAIDAASIERVVAAWGSQGCMSEWEGGFILKAKDGRWGYVWGWCDTTGWGCQDGATVEWYDAEPDRTIKRGTPQHMGGYIEALSGGDPKKFEHEWDESPEDLNRWHANGCKADHEVT